MHARSSQLVAGLAVASAATLLLGACSSGGTATPAAADGEPTIIKVGALTAPLSMDPVVHVGGPAYNFVAAAYETLVFPEPDGKLSPGIATSWEYTSPTELTMDIRTDVVFEDESGLDVDLVIANIERYRTTPGPNQARLNAIETVTAVDDDTIAFELNTPDLTLPDAFSGAPGMIVSQAALDDPTIMATDTAGSGPWVLAESIDGSSYVYEKSETYTGPIEVGYDTLDFTVIADVTSQLNSLLAGDVDIAVAQWTQRETAEAQGMEGVGFAGNVGGLWLLDRDGVVSKPLGDVRVRQAINYAIDREALGNALWSTYQRPTAQLFHEQSSGYDPELDDYYPYDVDKAKDLLAEAGYADGFTLPVLSRATYNDNGRLEATIPYLEAIGITVELVDRTADYEDAMASKEFAAAQSQGDMLDSYVGATNFLLANSAANPFGVVDPELDALITTAAAELDKDAAAEAWKAVSKWVVEQAWFAPISYYQTHNTFNPDVVDGVVLTPGNTISLPFTWTPAK